jgi:Ca-activated chloride channel homolog
VSFIWAPMLVLLLAIPFGIALYATRERRRRARAATLGSLQVAGPAGGTRTTTAMRRRVPAALFVLGLTVLVLAMARPQSVIGVPRFEGTVILSFDVSGSMAATDMTPSRMEAAKAAARTFVERQPDSILVGVVAFSDAGFSTVVPTTDTSQVLSAIDRLGPERGTSVARGILSALTAIAASERDPEAGYYTSRSPDPVPMPPVVPPGTDVPSIVVMLSDGENNQQPDPLAAAQAAAERGIRIYTVGLGTTEGADLEVEGFKVHSRLDDAMLKQIAAATGGTYYAAADPTELAAVYDQIQTKLVIKQEPMEVTSLFAGAGIAILLVGSLAGLFWLGRLP